jgi:PPOX class probable F420-dependent enzyme
MAIDLVTGLDYARARRWGVLVTLKADGRPQLSNIGYHVGEDGLVRVSVTADRAKTRNVARDPRVSLHVTADDFWSYVVLEGTAVLGPVTVAPDDAGSQQLVDLYRGIAGEHDDWDDYRAAMVAEHRQVLAITPTYAYGMLPG